MVNAQKIRAALVFQAVQLGQHLRVALAEAGIEVVAESRANALADSGFDDSIDVFVVNLDPELEDHLEEVSDLLDRYKRPVIFNDGAASSGLAGWDQARWARHLAAKIRGELDSHPPRPKDADFIPQHAKPNLAVRAVEKPADRSVGKLADDPANNKVAAQNVPPVQRSTSQSEPMLAAVALPKVAASPLASAVTGEASARQSNELPALNSGEAEPLVFDFKDDEFAWDEIEESSAVSDSSAKSINDMAPDVFDLPDFDLALEPMVDTPDDFETLLRSQRAEPPTAPAVTAPVIIAAAVPLPPEAKSAEKLKDAPMDWSLEPFDTDEIKPVSAPITGRASYSAKDVIAPVFAPKPTVLAATVAPIPANDMLDELTDLDFFTEMDELPVSPSPSPVNMQSPQNLDQLFADLDDISFDTSEPVSPPDSGAEASSVGSFVDDFDFHIDFDSPADSPAIAAASTRGAQTRELPVFNLPFSNTTNVDSSLSSEHAYSEPARVYVLGASIGGPEAVKTFLSKLKTDVPAAFVLAQHMGAEFLELMAGQLSKSSVLPVKLAQEGMALLQSEVVVVPVNKRFLVNAQGKIEFQEMFDESPYSPSIDQVMCDMSERFGSRCVGIIFSGMASDAVEGSKIIAGRGGEIWVQDPATCVISSMIEGAQSAGVVSFVGAPEQLADHVLEDVGVR